MSTLTLVVGFFIVVLLLLVLVAFVLRRHRAVGTQTLHQPAAITTSTTNHGDQAVDVGGSLQPPRSAAVASTSTKVILNPSFDPNTTAIQGLVKVLPAPPPPFLFTKRKAPTLENATDV
jgi:hypothetical protein